MVPQRMTVPIFNGAYFIYYILSYTSRFLCYGKTLVHIACPAPAGAPALLLESN
jgi:hypothetical protein